MTTTLIVQTPGAVVPDANTYLDVAMSDLLAEKYGLTAWVDNLEDKTTPLFIAAQYLDNIYGTSFKGYLLEPTQPMAFPRTAFYKDNGILVPQGAIPEELTLAQLQLAIQSINGSSLYAPPSTNGNLKQLSEEVADGVSRTQIWFSPNSSYVSPMYPITLILGPLLGDTSTGRTVRA